MHRQPVTRERIGETALGILDAAADESGLTMRALATVLGVQAPSLYAHVSGIDDVLALVHARINSSIDLEPLADADPIEGLRLFAHHYRDAYRRHLVAATIIITRSVNADHALLVYEPIAACLVRAGVPIERVMPCMAMLDNLVLGSAIEPFAAAFVGPSRAYRRAYPSIAEALRTSRRRHLDDEGFELGLTAFLDVVRRLSRTAASPGVVVRSAHEAELDAIGDLCVTAYTRAGHLEADDPYTATLRDARARAEGAELLVALRDGVLVGTVTICPPGSPFAEVAQGRESEFRFLAVAPAARRAGVGEALVAACEQRARDRGASAQVICVVEGNEPARRLYRRLGFERLPERDWQPRPGIRLQAYTRAVPHEAQPPTA